MKALSILALLLPLSVWASEASDRADIEKTIAALNDSAAAPSAVWAPGVDGPAQRAKTLPGSPMSEVFGGRISPGSIEFPARRTALVHATQTQFGSLILSRTVPVLIMMRKVRGGWRIQEIRPGQ
jgi:hypothetical protein